MNQNAPHAKETRIKTSTGDVRIRSFCSPEFIRNLHFDAEFGTHAQFKSLYTRRESLENDAAGPDANVVLALSGEDHIIGFAVLAYPEEGERWLDLGPGLMMELRVIEVCRSWRSGNLAHELLKMAMAHPEIEDKIIYMVGYSWTWDLDGTASRAQEYRQILIRLFETCGFQEYETNEPNICLKQENLFMCRVGRRVSDEIEERFNWLRFGIVPDIGPPSKPVDQYAAGSQDRDSLFYPLIQEGLTFLGIYHNWKNGSWTLRAGMEWDGSVDWDAGNRQFFSEHPLLSNPRHLGHESTLELVDRWGVRDHLDAIVERIRQNRHIGMECYLEPRRDIRVLSFMHSNTLAKGHRYHALRSGSICRMDDAVPESEAIFDGLNTSRAASFNNAVAGLPFGGGRIVIRSRSLEADDRGSMGFLAFVLDRTRSVVGPDLGFAPEIVDRMDAQGDSPNGAGGHENSPMDSPGALTAYGVYLALKEAVRQHYGSSDLAGRKIVVQGVGSVGTALVEHYLTTEQADVFVCDIRRHRMERLEAKLAGRVKTIDPDSVLQFAGDILVPCAHGNVLDEGTINTLPYGIVLGSANATLRAAGQAEEIQLANTLRDKGILYQVDWMHNVAGMISVVERYFHPQRPNIQRVMQQVEEICRDGVRENFEAARAAGVSPTEQAYRKYEDVIFS
jgi:leucine dehydrogenase